MFRSPISLPSFSTSAFNSSRKAISFGKSAAAFVVFLPGIRIKKNHVATITAATKSASNRTRRHEPNNLTPISADLFSESKRTQNEKHDRHNHEHAELWPVLVEICATQNNPAH